MADLRSPLQASNQYGALERRVARLLSNMPWLRIWLKRGYARAVYLLNGRHPAAFESRTSLHQVGPDNTDTFFGYYDKSPLSGSGRLLCHASPHSSNRPPQSGHKLAVQVYELGAQGSAAPIMSVETRCYNWQQGARAQWLDDDHFIFNDFDPEQRQYISRVHSISGREEVQRYTHAVQDAWGREYFLAINYRRLHALRPEYGYSNLPPLDERALKKLEDDGIWRVEQKSGDSRLLYSLQDICRCEPSDDFPHARHKVNHVMIAPDGRRFIFLHRYFIGKRKFDRLMLGAADGSGLRVLSAHGMVSHCFWMTDSALLCYLRGPNGRDGYHKVDISTGKIESVFGGALDAMGDGHPHVHGQWFVTDTYPDKRRMQHLLKADLNTGVVSELGRFYQSFRYDGPNRCDLHPRISPDGQLVFFDSVCSGRRRLHFLELDPP